jgi:uncharacterized protein YabN with tetrapyrrole methylase and pyrophosphatase domain
LYHIIVDITAGERRTQGMNLHQMMKILAKAQNTYGYANQVTVAVEELSELSAILCKYIRYPDHTTACKEIRKYIAEEVADVVICLNHLFMMFNIDEEELLELMDKKLIRLNKWLSKSDSPYETTKDREV